MANAAAAAVRATAWCRVDLGGGTLDIWPLGLLFPGAVTVNVALDLPVAVTVARRASGYRVTQGGSRVEAADVHQLAARTDTALIGTICGALALPPLEVAIDSSSPLGGGLGASSAVTVALIAGADRLLGRPAREPAALCRLARDLEAVSMRLPTGMQDHYGAVTGGALAIHFAPGGERVERLDVDLAGLSRHLLVVYSGRSHFSAATNWEIIRGCLEAEPETQGLFTGIARVAAQLPQRLEAGDWEGAGELVGQEWSLRRHLAAGVSVPAVESLLSLARSLGAWGGKACGAGGGGCVAILAPEERRAVLAASLAAAGGEVLSTAPTPRGLELGGLDDAAFGDEPQ
ncbi:MAG TPA: hypothetical protein VMT16_05835 [Thermoanaerobaculia bacterium]|nr:hypothetical protein [Thermoanaerobaculia bacterium]